MLPGAIQADSHIAVVYAEREFMPPQLRAFIDAVMAWEGEYPPARGRAEAKPKRAGEERPSPRARPAPAAPGAPPDSLAPQAVGDPRRRAALLVVTTWAWPPSMPEGRAGHEVRERAREEAHRRRDVGRYSQAVHRLVDGVLQDPRSPLCGIGHALLLAATSRNHPLRLGV